MNKNIDDKIFEFAYMMAFGDATMRRAFIRNGNEKNDVTSFFHRKNKIKDICEETVKNYIKAILDGKEYNTLSVIDIVYKKSKKYGFTFGNAQKLVNMTVKYIFLGCYLDKEKKNKFKNCHCPMDSKIISKVNDKLDNKAQIKKNVAWSRINKDQYLQFQEDVKVLCNKKNISPLEFDFFYFYE